MEVAAFVLGLSELIGVYDNACRVWRTISEAKDFGEDMADYLARLEMQFFKFDLWWQFIQKMAVPRQPVHSQGQQASHGKTECQEFQEQLRHASREPIQNAAAAIHKLLDDVQKILKIYKVLEEIPRVDQASSTAEVKDTSIKTIQSGMDEAVVREKIFISSLQKKTPWYKRVKAGATPWRANDKDVLEVKLVKLTGWNENLYSLLPSEMKDGVLRQGLVAFLFESEDIDARSFAGLQESTDECEREVAYSAQLFKMRRQFAEQQPIDLTVLTRLKKRSLDIDDLEVLDGVGFRSVGQYGSDAQPEVLIEWYKYNDYSPEEKAVALQRLQQLSLIFNHADKIPTLHVCDSVGVVDDEDRAAFGLVSSYPSNTPWPSAPVTLHELLRGQKSAWPSLEQRRRLAQRISSAVFALMVLRWFHKNFSAHNILFFIDRQTKQADLERPYIFGFDVARPDRPGEVSINAGLRTGAAIYRHPDVRSDVAVKARYQRRYEIFALGMALVEVGFWKTIDALVPGADGLSADELVRKIKGKCQTELGFFMGERYRDIAVTCLTLEESDGLGESLAEFYGVVVRDLIDHRV